MNQDFEVKMLPIDDIMPNPYQPRRHFDHVGLSELAESIKQVGILSPVSVRQVAGGYELISGERRLRAASLAGILSIPAIVFKLNDTECAIVSIADNIQSERLNYFEEAECIYNLINCHALTEEEVSQRLGKSESVIANKLKLLKLPQKVRNKLLEKNLGEHHARALLRIPDEEKQLEVIHKILQSSLTAPNAERLVQQELENMIKERNEKQNFFTTPEHKTRFYINTLMKTVDMLCKSGASATVREIESDQYIEYRIILAKE